MHKFGLAITLVGALAVGGPGAVAFAKRPLLEIAVAELPREAQQTEQLIRRGGPFPYGKDGTVFGNRERLLPPNRRGYYREYTVASPGSRDRGGRRIVCGGNEPVRPDACYYTDDHYASFRLIAR